MEDGLLEPSAGSHEAQEKGMFAEDAFGERRRSTLDSGGIEADAVQGEDEEDARAFWKAFNLNERKQALDLLEIEISEHTERSVLSRKKLASHTKQFRKVSDPGEKSKAIGPLLRSYQEEIDNLTKRARFAEKVFRDLYKDLHDAPDPAPQLDVAARSEESLARLRAENHKLRKELGENEAEFAQLQNQDVKIRQLEKQLQEVQRDAEAKLAEAMQAKEAELVAELENKSRSTESVETNWRRQVQDLNGKIAELQADNERQQEQAFELRTALEEADAARQSELDMLGEELQRTNAQLSVLASENAELKAGRTLGSPVADHRHKGVQGLGQDDAGPQEDRRRVLELEDEVIRREDLEESLRGELAEQKALLAESAEAHRAELGDMEGRVQVLKEEIFALKVQLQKRPTQDTVDQLKGQLRLMQAMDVGELDDPTDRQRLERELQQSSKGGQNHADGQDAFDSAVLVRGRIRKLEATAAALRVDVASRDAELDELRRANASFEERMRDKEELIRKLEKGTDVLTRQGSRRSNNQVGEDGMASPGDADPSSADLLAAATEDVVIAMPQAQVSAGDASDASFLSIVHEQRNEFRKRMLELEAERDDLLAQAREHQQDIQSLQTDNVELFEKIKYLQAYQEQQQQQQQQQQQAAGSNGRTGGIGSRMNANQRSELRLTMQGRAESKYGKLYEDKVNPFSDFSAQERRKRYSGLNAAEKMTLSVTSFFLSNKYTRLFVFCYAVTLHLLVSIMLFSNTHTSCLDNPTAPAAARSSFAPPMSQSVP